MLSNIEICFIGLAITFAIISYYGKGKGMKVLPSYNSNEIPIEESFPNPKPLFSLKPEMLSSQKDESNRYLGERDHIYVNKVLRFPYFQTMSHQQMKSEDWLEIDGDYLHDLKEKEKLIKIQGKVVLDIIDDDKVRLGCQELMQKITNWLCFRYPNLFLWEKKDFIILNKITNQSISLYKDEKLKLKSGIDALEVVSKLVQDDFLIGSPMGDGHWLCAGGLVCFPGFYLLSEKIGTSLAKSHEPVPQFNEKLLLSVERTLTRLQPNSPIERTSWEIVDSKEDQFWVPMAGPLPTKSGAKPMYDHHLIGRPENAHEFEDAGKLLLRLDHQTFTKMPKSGIVFFGIHPFRRPLEELRYKPLLPKLLLDIHSTGQKDLMKYKAAPQYEKSVIPFLQSLHDFQISKGIAKHDDKSQEFRDLKERTITIP